MAQSQPDQTRRKNIQAALKNEYAVEMDNQVYALHAQGKIKPNNLQKTHHDILEAQKQHDFLDQKTLIDGLAQEATRKNQIKILKKPTIDDLATATKFLINKRAEDLGFKIDLSVYDEALKSQKPEEQLEALESMTRLANLLSGKENTVLNNFPEDTPGYQIKNENTDRKRLWTKLAIGVGLVAAIVATLITWGMAAPITAPFIGAAITALAPAFAASAWDLGSAILTGVLGAVTLGLGAYLYKNSDTFKAICDTAGKIVTYPFRKLNEAGDSLVKKALPEGEKLSVVKDDTILNDHSDNWMDKTKQLAGEMAKLRTEQQQQFERAKNPPADEPSQKTEPTTPKKRSASSF